MSWSDYLQIVSALCCGRVYAYEVYCAWRMRIPAERFTDWLDFPEMF